MRLNLKAKILLLVSLLVVAGILLLAVRLAAQLQGDLERMVTKHLRSSVDYLASDLDDKIQLRLNALSAIASSVTAPMLANRSSAQRFLDERKISTSLFPVGIFLVNREGRIIADYPHVKSRVGAVLRSRRFFQRVMATGRIGVGRPIIGRFLPKPMVPLAAPIRNAAGKTVGVLVGASLVSDLAMFGRAEEARLGTSGFIIVASPRSRLIVWASDKKRILTPMSPRGVNPLLDRRIDDGYEGAGTVVNSTGIRTLALSRKLKTTGWIMIAGVSTKSAYAPIRRLKREVYIGAVVMSLVIVAILYLVLRQQLTPLEDAASAMRRMGEGTEPLAPIPIRREDEIGELVGNFNRLVDERRQTEEKFHDLNRDLERRVEDRTKELASEIEERKAAESVSLDYSVRLQEMTHRYISAEESEKAKLARELHDRVSSSLTAIGLNLGLIERQLSEDSAKRVTGRLKDTTALLRDAISTTREISSDLHPASLTYGGVLAALDDYARKFRARTGIDTKVEGSAFELRLAPETEIALFRIAQEAMVNCAKHAHAGRVGIEMTGSDDHVLLVIGDDGAGFDPGSALANASPGLGLVSMRERAEAIGASFRIASVAGQGTQIFVHLRRGTDPS